MESLHALSRFLFFKEESQVTQSMDAEKWRRTQLYMFVTSALVSIWGLFDFVIDFKNVWLFIALRAVYTPLTLWVAFNFNKPIFRNHHHRWAQIHYVFLIIDIGLMVLLTEHFIKYLIGFSTIFWGASGIMLWRFWNTVIPGIAIIIVAALRFLFFPHNVEIDELITGAYFFSTCLTFTSIISAYIYNSSYAFSKSQIDLGKANKRLIQSEKMQSLNLVVGGVAHELSSPVGVVRQAMSMSLSESEKVLKNITQDEVSIDMIEDPLKNASKGLKIGLHAADRLSNMVKDLKQTAVDQKPLDTPREFNPMSYIREHIIEFAVKQKLTENSVSIDLEGEKNTEIMSYPGALSQIVTNLILNAIGHGLCSDAISDKRIRILIRSDEHNITISVADNGIGICPKIINNIFDPYFSTIEAGITEEMGSGLGLNIVYNLVTSTLEGTISVDSTLGEGTVFTIVFPVILTKNQA